MFAAERTISVGGMGGTSFPVIGEETRRLRDVEAFDHRAVGHASPAER
jgi:hypothetical protein